MSITIDYYSDVLCIWSYATKIKIDEMKRQFNDQISINYRYTPLFVDMHSLLEKNWADKGGLQGYNKMMHKLNGMFPYVEIHPEVGLKNLPRSSASCHQFLKAIALMEQRGEIISDDPQNTLLEQADWLVRLGYFRDANDVSLNSHLMSIAEQLNIPLSPLETLLTNGEAMAALASCTTDDKQKLIEGCPSFVLNEGRQKLYGNIGYQIIEANIKVLLEKPENKPAWY
ncbi:MAG: DsbA family protein [gamma proteobacterium symbiont of Bathyaustriella thionipta]|nr:DsbA family protein [gamma proteobacterium symbiont of Bathyaustriella thionipta]MCU7948914.1 DsbA family protein [gamma proteobacterium symbiont of Bathyaustriella thionipta]MCU7954303.1 DsbA family protein [gamma proteobacterium symbiont of Bathyaustriella thionipta]MCU7955621.1 DsbA family protein [gamma proteobacterium symbiont of Bathyaustriella thionipta]MCU7966645.1 DsbA family protein [gamma proteobacterium symbiont of Bathyaustriella thionipta]